MPAWVARRGPPAQSYAGPLDYLPALHQHYIIMSRVGIEPTYIRSGPAGEKFLKRQTYFAPPSDLWPINIKGLFITLKSPNKTTKPGNLSRPLLYARRHVEPLSPSTPDRRCVRLKRTNLPVERLSLNRSQCGGCSTEYDTPTES